MAVYTNAGGGGGASSDELTAARGDVLKGKTAVTSDSSDEPVEGTLELIGDAADSHVLTGKTYYNKDPKTRRTGTMPNRGAVAQELAAGGSYTIPEGYHNGGGKVTAKSLASQTGGATAADGDVLSGKTYWKDGVKRTGSMANQGAKTASLNAGGSYAIPAGYHNGSGRVTANSLASQTSANAAAGHILSGKTAWVNGSKLTGTLAVQSAISFSAAALSATSVRISWKNPARGPWQGVFIQMSTSGNPGTGGGTRKYTGAGNNPNQAGGSNYVDITGLSIGTMYYFTCTSYCDALGWGSSYNVSCKTRGDIFYDHGRNPANLKFGQPPAYGISENKWEGWWLTNTKVRFNSDHIDIPYDGSNHYSPEFIFGSSINVSAFSKIFAEVQIVNVDAAYEFNCVVRIYDGSKNYYDSSAYVDIRPYQGRRLTINCPLTYKNGSFKGIKFCNYKNQYSYGATGIKIYKIWAE